MVYCYTTIRAEVRVHAEVGDLSPKFAEIGLCTAVSDQYLDKQFMYGHQTCHSASPSKFSRS